MAERVNVLLMGGGGREHALAGAIGTSPLLETLYTTHPENPGLAALAQPVDVPVSIREAYRLKQFIEKHRIGLVVIGPEDPLAEGFADKLASPTCMVFGPGQRGAMLEADKAWAKQLMRSSSIPTADARVFSEAEAANAYLESRERDDPALGRLVEQAARFTHAGERRTFIDQQRARSRQVNAAYERKRSDLPVVKATGLAKGKGVVVPGSLSEALAAIEEIMVRRVYGEAGKQVLIEDRLEGIEVSVLAITDGRSILVLPPAQDHKRLKDSDLGPNTGGMGAFCPSDAMDEATMARVEREVLVPTVDALRREGIEYRGILYAGLMLTHAGPKVLEFNCRFGDPECQAIISRLRSDLLEVMLATCRGNLESADVSWDSRASCCVVLASEGYPGKPRSGTPISGLDAAAAMQDVRVYHAGTQRAADGGIVTNGGRVLGVTGLGETLAEARRTAYAACERIRFDGMQYRRDIGSGAAIKPKAAATL